MENKNWREGITKTIKHVNFDCTEARITFTRTFFY